MTALLPRYFLDFETTGLDPAKDHVVEVGLCGEVVLDRLVSDAPPSCEGAFRVHGLSEAHCRANGYPSSAVLEDLLSAIGPGPVEIVAHNATFEQGFLETWATREGVRLPEILWRCTLDAARSLAPTAPFSLNLGSLASIMGWSTTGLHRAGVDAALTARLWEALEAWKSIALTLGPSPGLVYMAGPFRGDGSRRCMRHNRNQMAQLCRWAQAVLSNATLVVPHLNFAYIDEAGSDGHRAREKALAACEALVKVSQAILLCGRVVTPGMHREVRAAHVAHIPVLPVPGWDPFGLPAKRAAA